MKKYRLIVLGLGGIGSGAAYWASRRLGEQVLGIEQYEMGHPNGGSEDHSRIIRLSYHTPAYVRLAQQAYQAWSALEEDAGRRVVLRTGGLDLAPAGATIGLDDYRHSMTEAGVGFEELTSEELMRRWPQWRLDEDVTGLYQEESGIAMATIANATHRAMARDHGAELSSELRVVSVDETDSGIRVATDDGTYECESLLVCAGAWTNRVLESVGLRLPLEITQEQVVYFTPTDPEAFAPDRFPVWIWMTEPSFYGFPVFGEPALKVGWDRCQLVTTPETRSHAPLEDVTAAMREYVNRYLPGAAGGVHLAKTCLYTLTPDRDFVIDRVPGTRGIYMAVGAGHAFKFASLIGRTMVEMALDGTTQADVTPFTADRAVLVQPNPVRSYMV